MMLDALDYERIRKWIYTNARPLEYAKWRYHFEGESVEEVLKIVRQYQNPDGGFGNAFEADSWNHNSSPYTTSIAILLLEELSIADADNEIIKGILNYLENTNDFVGGFWPATIPSNNDYPHAPWWTFISKENLAEWGYNPTALLAGFIIRFANVGSDIYKKAVDIAKRAVECYLCEKDDQGKLYRDLNREGEITCFSYLVSSLEATTIVSHNRITDLKDALKEQVAKFIEKNTANWNKYCCKPSQFIDSPNNIFYENNEEIVEYELDYIIKNRNSDGVWDIVWNWMDYREQWNISRNWWKSQLAIQNMLLLKAFNRIKK